MKKILWGTMVMFCSLTWLMAQSGKITAPKANDVWTAGAKQSILWNHSGQGLVRLLLYAQSGAKVGVIKSGLQLGSGAFSWTVGKLENGVPVPPAKGYKIRLKMDGSALVLDPGAGPFEIVTANVIPPAPIPPGNPPKQMVVLNPNPTVPPGNQFSLRQALTIHAPKSGAIWKPLSDYDITWEAVKNKYPASSYSFDVKLEAAANQAFSPLILKKNHWSVAKDTGSSKIYTFNWKFLGSTNIPSGKYKVTVKSVSIPDFKGESGTITVQNTVASNTAFLGEDEFDLIIEEVYYDLSKKSMWARIKNQGFSSYSGPLTIKYQFKLASVTYNTPDCSSGNLSGEAKFPNITLNKFQANGYFICKWPCFDKRPADFFPITGPVKYDVSVYATDKISVVKSGVICKSKVPDIIVNDPFRISCKYDPYYLWAFEHISLDPRHFNWISKETFEAKVEVNVRNWGCQGKQFDIKLHMEGNYLNGKKEVLLGTISLAPGQETTFVSGPVKFSIPKDNQYHKMLLVAYQGEANGEGYPDAYKNNFILTHVRFEEKSNTVRGNGL